MEYVLTYKREDSMSVSEAVERIKKRTDKRRDTCARQFAETLMSIDHKLPFWQNVPPDKEDLTSAQSAGVTKFLRKAVSARMDLDARTIGPWIMDVYAGSMAKKKEKNKWNEPYPYQYPDDFNKCRLPLPLMKDFRANKKLMLSICNAAIEKLDPRKPKGRHTGTQNWNAAAEQVASMCTGAASQRMIEDMLREFIDDDRDWTSPIHEIGFVPSGHTQSELSQKYPFDAMVITWDAGNREIKAKIVSLEVFAKKVKALLD